MHRLVSIVLSLTILLENSSIIQSFSIASTSSQPAQSKSDAIPNSIHTKFHKHKQEVKSEMKRRDVFQSLACSFILANNFFPNPAQASPKLDHYNPDQAKTSPASGQNYFPTITPPFQNRATVRYDLGRDAYALEQLLTFGNVTATIRTIVQIQSNGKLWIHGPLYPTGEYQSLLNELGEVEHVVLPCNALEHKAPMEAFCKVYQPKSVWISPGQYSVFGSCGKDLSDCHMPYHVDGVIPLHPNLASTENTPPWSDEFDYRTLYLNLPKNAGPVSETAFLHRPTHTLITTDSVIYIPDTAPPIFSSYFQTLGTDFWPKTVLQSIFLPLRQESSSSSSSNENIKSTDYPGYNAIQGRLLRAPILRSFVDARAPTQIQSWVQEVSSMGNTPQEESGTTTTKNGFDRILTAHFASPISASPKDFQTVFGYLNNNADNSDDGSNGPPIPCQDWELLQSLNDILDKTNLAAPTMFDVTKGCIP